MSKLKDKIDAGLIRYYLEANIEHVKENLAQEGIDVEEEEKAIAKFVKRLKFEKRARAAQEKQKNLLDLVVLKFQDAIQKNLERPIATLNTLIAEKQLRFHNRNLEKLSETEIKEIIEGKNLVDLLDSLDDSSDEN